MHMVICIIWYLYTGTAHQQGDIQFINGTGFNGRLEIYDSIDAEWLTICMDGFTISGANTACKQLGRAGAVIFGPSEMLGY